MTSANWHQAFYGLWMRGADWASVGDGGRPEEVGIAQEQGMLRQPATCCYSYTHCRLGFKHRRSVGGRCRDITVLYVQIVVICCFLFTFVLNESNVMMASVS